MAVFCSSAELSAPLQWTEIQYDGRTEKAMLRQLSGNAEAMDESLVIPAEDPWTQMRSFMGVPMLPLARETTPRRAERLDRMSGLASPPSTRAERLDRMSGLASPPSTPKPKRCIAFADEESCDYVKPDVSCEDTPCGPGGHSSKQAMFSALQEHSSKRHPKCLATPPRKLLGQGTLAQTPVSFSTPTSSSLRSPCTPQWRNTGVGFQKSSLPSFLRELSGPVSTPRATAVARGDEKTPPAVNRRLTTPPSHKRVSVRRTQDEIAAALRSNCLPSLTFALLRGHSCTEAHVMHEAVRQQQVAALEFLVLKAGPKGIDAHCSGRRPLHLAVQTCMTEGDSSFQMIELLMQHGARAEPVLGDAPNLDSPLHIATKRGCTAAVKLLLAYKANPDIADAHGHTPLHIVCRQCPYACGVFHQKVVKELLAHGACPFKADLTGKQPIYYTTDNNLTQMLREAEQDWFRHALDTLRQSLQRSARSGQERFGASTEVLSECLELPELFEMVVGFL